MSNSQSPDSSNRRTLRSDVRNPRRRPRQSDTDSMKTAPRRKRSKITEETFVPIHSEQQANGTIETHHANGTINGIATKLSQETTNKDNTPLLEATEIPVRNKKSSTKRPVRGDGATVLAQNERYSMKLLPNTPKEIQQDGVRYRGSIGALHHALAITKEKTYIWEYTSHAPVVNVRTFDLPFQLKALDPLPFGALVNTGSSTDFGMVLISAASGTIVFYESVERIASLGIFHDHSATAEGSTPSLWSGETVCELTSAGHAGFVLTLSSGRLVHFTLRDTQGRARINSEFLRVEQEHPSGLFGSIKGYLGTGAFRKDLAAVHVRSLDKHGKEQVIAVTAKAELLVWNIDWNGQSTSSNSVDFRELLVEELKQEEAVESQGRAESFEIQDFAIMDTATSTAETATPGVEMGLTIMTLLQIGSANNRNYVLAEIGLDGDTPSCMRLVILNTYDFSNTSSNSGKPSLTLPAPQHSAIICHHDAMTFVGLPEIQEDSPDAQLRGPTEVQTVFEDTAYLHTRYGFEVLDVVAEPQKSTHSTEFGTAFVKGCGLVRFSVTHVRSKKSEPRLTAKEKIEQAVFHGALQERNILDFSRRSNDDLAVEDVEQAALMISDEILRSKSHFIADPTASIGAHLEHRAEALRALAIYVRQNYPALTTEIMWQLLWDAEKLAAGQVIWRNYETQVAAMSKDKRTATLIDEVCTMANQHEPQPASKSDSPGSSSIVRGVILHGLHRVDRLFVQVRGVLDTLRHPSDHTSETKMRIVEEACTFWTEGLETVFRFRSENASSYGILTESIDDGILTDPVEFRELPEFWTSTESMLKAIVKITDLTGEIAAELFENEQDEAVAARMEPAIHRCGAAGPRLVAISCLIYQERINWLSSRKAPKDRELAQRLDENYKRVRHDQIRGLANVAQSAAGLKIAEKYHDMETLTEMIVAEMQFAVEEFAIASDERRLAIVEYLEENRTRIDSYFERFGDDWANAYFDVGFSTKAGLMLDEMREPQQKFLTKYLRAEPSRAKVCWINDLIVDKDYSRAGHELTLAGRELETRLWNRKVEFSLAKLAALATQEDLEEKGAAIVDSELETLVPEHDLAIVRIQQQLFDHIRPEVMGLIDQQAELQEAITRFGLKNQDLHSLRQLLYTGLERVLAHDALSAAELIDVFTLMDSYIAQEQDDNLRGSEFFCALRVLNAAAPEMPPQHVETLLQLIWKRCYVYDDWIAIDSAQAKGAPEEETTSMLRETMPWQTLYLAFDQAIFDQPNSRIRHIQPTGCLGAACLPDDLSWRFPEPDLLDPILHDNRVHDEQLQGLVDDRRLEQWIQLLVSDVRNTIKLERELKAAADAAAVTQIDLTGDDTEILEIEPALNGDPNHTHTHAHVNGIKIEPGFEPEIEADHIDDIANIPGGLWGSAGQDSDLIMAE